MADQIHNRGEGDKILCRPKGTVGGSKKKKTERKKREKERDSF